MLDLLARHGRLDLDVEAAGDLQTGAHHTVEDVGICIGQALDRALGDRSGIMRYGDVTVPMDEARAACAIDISGRGLLVFEADFPSGAIGNYDHELTEEFLRALAANAQADPAPDRSGRDQRPPHGRGVLQGARAGAARRHGDRSDRDGRPQHEGHADMSGEHFVFAGESANASHSLSRPGGRTRRRKRRNGGASVRPPLESPV